MKMIHGCIELENNLSFFDGDTFLVHIPSKVLNESVVITSLGGSIGIGVAMIASVVISNVLPFNLVPTFQSYFYAVGASIVIGIVFGIIPAIKASRIDPIKAIQG